AGRLARERRGVGPGHRHGHRRPRLSDEILASSLFSFARLSIERRGGVSVRGGRGVRMAAPAIALEVGVPTTESGEAETRDAPREDPFGLDPELRRRVLPAARFLPDRHWRLEVTGMGPVPARRPALLAA